MTQPADRKLEKGLKPLDGASRRAGDELEKIPAHVMG
jgi:hypothetical protein